MIELRQAGNDEPHGDVQSAENANTDATFSKLQLIFITEAEKALNNIVVAPCCVVRKCLQIDPEILEYITFICLRSDQE